MVSLDHLDSLEAQEPRVTKDPLDRREVWECKDLEVRLESPVFLETQAHQELPVLMELPERREALVPLAHLGHLAFLDNVDPRVWPVALVPKEPRVPPVFLENEVTRVCKVSRERAVLLDLVDCLEPKESLANLESEELLGQLARRVPRAPGVFLVPKACPDLMGQLDLKDKLETMAHLDQLVSRVAKVTQEGLVHLESLE